MIVSTTTAIDGRPVSEYVGVVTGEAVLGANVSYGPLRWLEGKSGWPFRWLREVAKAG